MLESQIRESSGLPMRPTEPAQKEAVSGAAGSVAESAGAAREVNILFQRGGVLYQGGKLDEAVKVWQKVLRIHPDNPHALTNIGIVFVEQKRWTEAHEIFTKLVGLAPENLEAHYGLGLVFMHRCEYARSAEEWERVLDIQPDNENARAYLLLVRERLSLEETGAAGAGTHAVVRGHERGVEEPARTGEEDADGRATPSGRSEASAGSKDADAPRGSYDEAEESAAERARSMSAPRQARRAEPAGVAGPAARPWLIAGVSAAVVGLIAFMIGAHGRPSSPAAPAGLPANTQASRPTDPVASPGANPAMEATTAPSGAQPVGVTAGGGSAPAATSGFREAALGSSAGATSPSAPPSVPKARPDETPHSAVGDPGPSRPVPARSYAAVRPRLRTFRYHRAARRRKPASNRAAARNGGFNRNVDRLLNQLP